MSAAIPFPRLRQPTPEPRRAPENPLAHADIPKGSIDAWDTLTAAVRLLSPTYAGSGATTVGKLFDAYDALTVIEAKAAELRGLLS